MPYLSVYCLTCVSLTLDVGYLFMAAPAKLSHCSLPQTWGGSKEQGSFNFIAAITICSDFGVQDNKICHCFQCFTLNLPEVMRKDAMIFIFKKYFEFQASFFSLFFTFFKRLFRFSSHSAIRVLASAYLMLLIFLLEILTPACDSSSPPFLHDVLCI